LCFVTTCGQTVGASDQFRIGIDKKWHFQGRKSFVIFTVSNTENKTNSYHAKTQSRQEGQKTRTLFGALRASPPDRLVQGFFWC
jgi:hypothetical protein